MKSVVKNYENRHEALSQGATKEVRELRSQMAKAVNKHKRKMFIDLETGIVYETETIARAKLGLSKENRYRKSGRLIRYHPELGRQFYTSNQESSEIGDVECSEND